MDNRAQRHRHGEAWDHDLPDLPERTPLQRLDWGALCGLVMMVASGCAFVALVVWAIVKLTGG